MSFRQKHPVCFNKSSLFEAQIFAMPWIHAKRRQILEYMGYFSHNRNTENFFHQWRRDYFFQMRRSFLRIYLVKKVHS